MSKKVAKKSAKMAEKTAEKTVEKSNGKRHRSSARAAMVGKLQRAVGVVAALRTQKYSTAGPEYVGHIEAAEAALVAAGKVVNDKPEGWRPTSAASVRKLTPEKLEKLRQMQERLQAKIEAAEAVL